MLFFDCGQSATQQFPDRLRFSEHTIFKPELFDGGQFVGRQADLKSLGAIVLVFPLGHLLFDPSPFPTTTPPSLNLDSGLSTFPLSSSHRLVFVDEFKGNHASLDCLLLHFQGCDLRA